MSYHNDPADPLALAALRRAARRAAASLTSGTASVPGWQVQRTDDGETRLACYRETEVRLVADELPALGVVAVALSLPELPAGAVELIGGAPVDAAWRISITR